MSDDLLRKYTLFRATVGTEEMARRLAKILVKNDYCISVHVSKVDTFYKWKGKYMEDQEWEITGTSAMDKAGMINAVIQHVNDYDLTEVIFYEVDSAEDVKRWIASQEGGITRFSRS